MCRAPFRTGSCIRYCAAMVLVTRYCCVDMLGMRILQQMMGKICGIVVCRAVRTFVTLRWYWLGKMRYSSEEGDIRRGALHILRSSSCVRLHSTDGHLRSCRRRRWESSKK